MSDLNKILIMGRTGSAPEVRYTQSGQAVCSFSVATCKRFKDKDGNLQSKTTWHRAVCWGKQAESCAKFLIKGSRVFIVGEIETRQWQNKEGVVQYATDVVVSEINFLDKPKSENTSDEDISF